MGGDIGHHASQWRPSQHIPLPTELTPSPFGFTSRFNIRRNVCLGELFSQHAHPNQSSRRPFTKVKEGHPHDVQQAQQSLEKMVDFDADEKILVVAAHDFTMLPVLQYFPEEANGWYEAGWKQTAHWEFLKGLTGIVEDNVQI